jgi:tetratricopeptide (TPR) repeat protein
MSPEGRKDRIMEALKRIVLKGSEIRPLIMAIEDLHWIDNSSEDSFKALLDSITAAKVFLIFTYRPEFNHNWGLKSYHSQLNLNRLSNRESLAMLTYFLEAKKIDRALEGLILDKTEGVPFFIEEFIRSIKDLKIIEKKGNKYHMAKDIQNVTIPSTIQDVIMARVDSLPDTTKRTLQICSVIEREFSYDLINRVADFSESELIEHLFALNDSELLYQRGIFPQTTYIFKHALTREVVYDSILNKKKKNLHEKIGDVIEELYQKNIHEHYGLLAEHYIASENYEKATEYLRLAARKDEKAGSFTDAISYTERRIACLERLPQTEDVKKKIIDARTTLGLYYIQTDFFVKAKEAIEPIVELTVKRNNKRRVAQIYSILGTYKLTVENDFPKAFIHFEKALKISEEVNDVTSLVLTSWVLGAAQAQNCEFKKAFQNIGKALSINTAANILWGISIMKSCQSYCCYNPQGLIKLAYQTSEQAIGIAEESDDTYSKSIVYPQSGCSSYHKGFFKEAKEYLLKGADFCERINSNMWNSVAQRFLGDTYFELGEYQKSKDHYEIGFLLLESNRMQPSWIYLNKIGIAKAEVMMDEKGIDLELLYTYEAKNKVKIYESDMQRYIAEILLNIDNQHMNEAEDWIKKAIEVDKRNGMMWHLGKDYALYSELHKIKSDLPKAKEKLNKAIEILKKCGADGWVEKYEKELAAF